MEKNVFACEAGQPIIAMSRAALMEKRHTPIHHLVRRRRTVYLHKEKSALISGERSSSVASACHKSSRKNEVKSKKKNL
jgi:hypothetical protein